MRKNLVIILILIVMLFIVAGCSRNYNDIKDSPGLSAKTEQSPENNKDQVIIEPEITGKNVNINIDDLTDGELRELIIEEAKSKGHNVYDLYDTKRSVTDNSATTVDIDQTVRLAKENNDMASTRFVFKGERVIDTESLELIAEYKTPLSSLKSPSVNNMKVANEKLNGIILRQNEEFSFRYFLGVCTKEDGYKEARIFVKDKKTGEVKEEEALGGGICQVSSTLHAACLESNLKIKERHEHSKEVGYIENGKDATISGDYYDLKFANNLTHPIVFIFKIEGKDEVVEIYKLSEETMV